jgi:hypothetical protein
MRIIVTVGAVALMACSTLALSQETTSTTTTATTTTTAPAVTGKPAEKLVCQTVEQLGTRLGGHRECKTRAQWAEERRLNREMIDRSQTQRACGMSTC